MDESEADTASNERSKAAWPAAAMILIASLGGAVVIAEWPLWGVQVGGPDEPDFVQPTPNGTALWPYTASGTSFESRTLGINVVIHGDSESVRRAMMRRSELRWKEEPREADPDTDEEADEDRDGGSGVDEVARFGEAHGSVRYTHVSIDGQGRWMNESYQLRSGLYLGQRMHLRAYEDPRGEWTALQVHDEHWDWFRLRHTVTGISDAQREVEADFMEAPFVEEVSRLPYQNPTADGDGWVTIVRLATVLLPGVGLAFVGRVRRTGRRVKRFCERHVREVVLGASVFSLYLGVRAAGVGLEVLLPSVPPQFLAAPLFVVLAVGLPGIAYLLGRGGDRVWTFTYAVLGLGSAFIVDFAVMGVSVIPLRFALHRFSVLLAIALVAAGAAYADRDETPVPLYFGLAGWTAALVLPIFGYI